MDLFRSAWLPWVFVLAVSGCEASAPGTCSSDLDCGGTDSACVDARCRCLSDAACPDGRVCNVVGVCQAPAPCARNADCGSDERCDGTTGVCGLAERCPRDLHCPLGQICQDETCVPGCRADDGCPLGQVCEGEGALGSCTVGCRGTDGCPLGAVCVGGRCFDDALPGLCAPCGGSGDCPATGDWCLENRAYDPQRPETGTPRHCAANCGLAPQICPNGYECRRVVARVTAPCRTDADCGFRRRCLIEEGEPVGACTCFADRDCTDRLAPTCRLGFCESPAGRTCASPADCEDVEACGPYGRGGAQVCFLDRSRSCASGADCQCIDRECVLSGRGCRENADCATACIENGCVVGAGCAPAEGLLCPGLRGN